MSDDERPTPFDIAFDRLEKMTAERNRLRSVLTELVACRDRPPHQFVNAPTDAWRAKRIEYDRRETLAWNAARKELKP